MVPEDTRSANGEVAGREANIDGVDSGSPGDSCGGDRRSEGQVAANRRWREKNREKYNAYMREYRRRNK